MRCAECGEISTDGGARYCGRCGAGLLGASSGRAATRLRPTTRTRRRVVLAGVVALTAIAVGAVIILALDRTGEPSSGPAAAESRELGLSEAWTTSATGGWFRGLVRPATTHGRVYTADGGAMYALDATSGDVRWRYAEREPIWGEPTVIGSIVVGTTPTGLVAVDTDDGRPIWRTTTDDVTWRDVHASPRVIVAGGNRGSTSGQVGVIGAFDALTGDERWVAELDDWLIAPPQWAEGTVVAATHTGGRQGTVSGLDGASGEVRWRVGISGWSTTIVHDGTVYVATSREVVAIDLHEGHERWRTELDPGSGDEHGVPQLAVVGDDLRLSLPHPEPTLVAIDAADGTLRWQRQLTSLLGEHRGEIGVADDLDGVVGIVDDERGVVRAVDSNGEIVWEQRLDRPLGHGIEVTLSRTEPDEGDVWVGTIDGRLVSLDLVDGEPRWERRLPPDAAWEPTLTTAAGLVLVGQHDEMIALDAVDGEERWRNEDPRGPGVHAIGPLGTVIVPSTATVARRLLEFEASTGSVLTEIRLDPPSNVRAITTDDARIYAGASGGVYAFDPTHRRQRWFRSTWTDVIALESDGTRVAAIDGDGRLHLLDAEDGDRLWMGRVDACTSPRFADGVVVVGTTRGVVAMDADTGAQRWRIAASRPMCVPVTVGDGDRIYLTDLIRTVTAVAADDGGRLWEAELDAGIAAPPGAAPHAVVVGDSSGVVHLLDPADGSTLEAIPLPSALLVPPAVHPDGMVLLDDTGDVHGIPTGG